MKQPSKRGLKFGPEESVDQKAVHQSGLPSVDVAVVTNKAGVAEQAACERFCGTAFTSPSDGLRICILP